MKVTEPCQESYDKFLAFAAKTDIFWFLRKFKTLRGDQLEGNEKENKKVLNMIKESNEEGPSSAIKFEEIPDGLRMKGVFRPFNYGAFWYLFGKDATDVAPSTSPEMSNEIKEALRLGCKIFICKTFDEWVADEDLWCTLRSW